jgi:RHS repeat-associated protein
VTAETCDGRTVANSYDVLGRRVERVTPTGAVSRWTYDAAGYPSALDASGQVLAFGYDPAGREISRRLRDVRLEQTWDANHRLHTQALTAPGPPAGRRLLQRRAYTYRPDGGVTNVIDQLAGVRQFELDPLGRATAVIAPDRQEAYGYDGAGNVTGPQRSHVGTVLRDANGARLEHDGHGRLIARHSTTLSGQRRTWRYLWNSDDRLVGVTTPDQVSWRYVYDPLGRRVAKLRLSVDGQVVERIWFSWDATTLAEQTRLDGATSTWDYQPGMHTPVAQTDRRGDNGVDAQFYAIVTDLVGTPAELVTPDGELAWRQRSTLWGVPLATTPQPAHCPLRFPGQYQDPETGHHYNLQRYYDPGDAAYLSADPLRLDGGPNPHAYVPNPLAWIDPLGLVPYNLPRGYRSSPVFTDDPYHESKVNARSEEWRKHFGAQAESPQDDLDKLARQARNEVRNGRGPSEIHRIDGPNTAVPGQQWHAQRKGKGSPALNQDGTFHDGDPQFSAKTHKWLRKYGWKTP